MIKSVLLLLATSCLLCCNRTAITVPESPFSISSDSFQMDTIVQGFTIPYGIAIVQEDEYFITDRIGKMYHYKAGQLNEILGIPKVVTFGTPGIPAIMHGGLMDVSIHPEYPSNPWIYISYLDPKGLSKVARIKIQRNAVQEIEPLFESRIEDYSGNGMRIIWQDSSHFFLNVGNSNWSTSTNPVLFAQDLNHDVGKIHRLMENGDIPIDNPIFSGSIEPTTIWTYGHRDVQGLFFEKSSNTLFGLEHGPQGGDEFNVIVKGKNYGWPLFSYGINYDGAKTSVISEDSAATFTILPEHYWTIPTNYGGQAIAPACLLKVRGSNIQEWEDHFLFGSLAYRRLMKYNRSTGETFGLNIEGRVRTIKQLPSGNIIALIERNDLKKTNGKIVRISKNKT